MKIGVAGSALFFAWTFAHPTGDTMAGERACSVKNCFSANDIRRFDVVDRTTLIVYVGSQRCAFRVELRGSQCDMTYAPELVFSDPHDVPLGEPSPFRNRAPTPVDGNPGVTQLPDISFDPDPRDTNLPTRKRGRVGLRVCDNDLRLEVSGGAFTDTPFADPTHPDSQGPGRVDPRFHNPRYDCGVSSVASLTDDQVLEVYVAHRLAPPPPPMGSGEIQVGKQTGEESKPAPAPNDSKGQ